LIIIVLGMAAGAYAFEATESKLPVEVEVPPPVGYEFYCQPPHVYLWTINASTAFASELADDIPDEFYCTNILDIVFYVSEWGGLWVAPNGVYVRFYGAECPPSQADTLTYYFTWAELETTLVYDDPGNFTSYRVKGYFPEPVHIEEDMSIGFQVDTYWGQAAPYAGVVATDDFVVFGDCEAYWDGTFWGAPRWTTLTGYFGTAADVAYCLSDGTGEPGSVTFLDCYIDGGIITTYLFDVTAGSIPVNDMEICFYIDWVPAPILACSSPGSWTCHFDPGTHCITWVTADNPIPPGETYGPFDVWIDPYVCYSTLIAVWTLTYDGSVVAGPDTSYWVCGPTSADPTSWGAIKSLYK
jgi:hypothetical protein